jgi:hypothetical protein
MLRANETENSREPARERADLKREYRPIGIGAVAAALSVTSRSAENQPHPANSNERRRVNGSIAA